MMEIKGEFVTTKVSDGTSMRLYVARPIGAAASRGLLVMQEAFGVNAHIRDVTERFAREDSWPLRRNSTIERAPDSKEGTTISPPLCLT
jgi:hypothetical protein